MREVNHVRAKVGKPYAPLLSPMAVVVLGTQMGRLVRDGIVKRFWFGAAPAPEGLLAELFTLSFTMFAYNQRPRGDAHTHTQPKSLRHT